MKDSCMVQVYKADYTYTGFCECMESGMSIETK